MRFPAALMSVLIVQGCSVSQQPRQFTLPEAKYFAPPTDYVPVDEITIKSNFDTVSLTAENLRAEQKKCVPLLSSDSSKTSADVAKFPSGSIIRVGHVSSSKQFIYRGTKGFCLEHSAAQFPIYAAEAFADTANPQGIPPDVMNTWYKQIALQIATSGQAKVVFVTTKGTAFLVSYWGNKNGGFDLYYSSEFKKVGEWEDIKVDATFAHPSMRSLTVTERGKSGQMVKKFPF